MVAIKAMHAKVYSRLQEENGIDEAGAMELCQDSDRIVNLVEMFKLDGWVFIVSKYASGGDLLRYCLQHSDGASDKAWLSEDRIHHIFSQIAHGIHDMHKIDLTHRDLKLINIFLSDDSRKPRIKIGDLGLAASLKPGEELIKRAGTKAFMAPEIILNQPAVFSSDIYSLGVILYTMIATHLPFSNGFYAEGNEKKLLEQEVSFPSKAFATVDTTCIDLIRAMLVKDPNGRLSIEGVLAHPWVSSTFIAETDSRMDKIK